MAGKVDELEKTIFVAARDPSLYGIKQVELEKRRKWTTTAPIQVGNIKKAVIVAGSSSNFGGMRQELMLLISESHRDKMVNLQMVQSMSCSNIWKYSVWGVCWAASFNVINNSGLKFLMEKNSVNALHRKAHYLQQLVQYLLVYHAPQQLVYQIRAQAVVAQSGLSCYPQIRAQHIQCLPLLDHHHYQFLPLFDHHYVVRQGNELEKELPLVDGHQPQFIKDADSCPE
ncbi:unnamed protein product [Lactuca saligna]|uniref:Uncharacterized protein n=1 Tax=Lactuca saligna TaxID=75948 RepID=A0AA35YVP3_LACSI|nr:unnamed protein product [Lactuca saligna]